MKHLKLIAIALGAVVAASMMWPAEAQAQRRRVVVRHAPARPSVVVGVGVVPRYRAYYYRPWFYDPWWPHAYYGYPFGYGHGPAYLDSAAVRIQVQPKETEVYIDGYWAGTVDDFDGLFQRLRLEPGEHEVQLYLQGYRSMQQKIYLQPNGSFNIKHTMVPLAPGDTPDPRPVAAPAPQGSQGSAGGAYGGPARPPRERRESDESRDPDRDHDFGALALRVQPGDAEVSIDGETWDAPDASERLVVQLPEGEHRLEIRKDGFSTYSSSVRIRRGETTTLNVSLAHE